MKQDLKGRHFVDVAEAHKEWMAALDSISIEDLRHLQQWEQHWDHCIQSQGSTLKRTKVSNLYEYFKYILCNSSGNFWIPLVLLVLTLSTDQFA
jgi:hypothetical protein